MAVYTEISDDELQAFVAEYDIGEVVSCKGIAEGVENSNYLLRTSRESYILTLYEKRVRESDLPYFLGLMEHLAAKGVPAPPPHNGRPDRGRPAAARRDATTNRFRSRLRSVRPAGPRFAASTGRPTTLHPPDWRRRQRSAGLQI